MLSTYTVQFTRRPCRSTNFCEWNRKRGRKKKKQEFDAPRTM